MKSEENITLLATVKITYNTAAARAAAVRHALKNLWLQAFSVGVEGTFSVKLVDTKEVPDAAPKK